MTAPTPGLMSILERTQAQLLTVPGQVYTQPLVSDGMGGMVKSQRTLLHDDMWMRFEEVSSAAEREVAERLELAAPQVLVVTKLYDLPNGAEVVTEGKTYRVAVKLPGGTYSVTYRYIVAEKAE